MGFRLSVLALAVLPACSTMHGDVPLTPEHRAAIRTVSIGVTWTDDAQMDVRLLKAVSSWPREANQPAPTIGGFLRLALTVQLADRAGIRVVGEGADAELSLGITDCQLRPWVWGKSCLVAVDARLVKDGATVWKIRRNAFSAQHRPDDYEDPVFRQAFGEAAWDVARQLAEDLAGE